MWNTKTAKYIVITILLLTSIGITWMQLSSREEKMTDVWMLARDIKKGEMVQQSDFYMGRIRSSSYPLDLLQTVAEVEGMVALVDLRAHSLAAKNVFGEIPRYEPKKGNALTAIKMLPDSAICWTTEMGESVDVYFVEDKEPVEKLGSVIVKGKLDQRMGENELYTFMVVEGSKQTILEIVEKRTNGRIEIVKQR